MKKVLLCLSLLSLCYATDYLSKQQNVFHTVETKPIKISKNYRLGKHLIYNCKDRYFVCVWEKSQKDCVEKEKYSLAHNHLNHQCRFFKSYKDEKDCELNQLKFISKQNKNKIREICSIPRK